MVGVGSYGLLLMPGQCFELLPLGLLLSFPPLPSSAHRRHSLLQGSSGHVILGVGIKCCTAFTGELPSYGCCICKPSG